MVGHRGVCVYHVVIYTQPSNIPGSAGYVQDVRGLPFRLTFDYACDNS